MLDSLFFYSMIYTIFRHIDYNLYGCQLDCPEADYPTVSWQLDTYDYKYPDDCPLRSIDEYAADCRLNLLE